MNNSELNTELWTDFTVEELEARTEYGDCIIYGPTFRTLSGERREF